MKPKTPTDILRERLRNQTQVDLAKTLGVTPQYLSDVLRGKREAGRKILTALGLQRVITWSKI